MRKHPMTAIESLQPFGGIVQTLNENDYTTMFLQRTMSSLIIWEDFELQWICTHYITKDYPSNKVVGPSWGS